MHKRFYESSKLKNWMGELCTEVFTNPVTIVTGIENIDYDDDLT